MSDASKPESDLTEAMALAICRNGHGGCTCTVPYEDCRDDARAAARVMLERQRQFCSGMGTTEMLNQSMLDAFADKNDLK